MGVIVYATAPLVVGQRYTREVIDNEGEAFTLPFVVLREATRDEWLASTENAQAKEDWLRSRSITIDSYYEISTD